MKTMRSVRIKPNPAGKDRTRRGATAAQLGAEWVDLKNEGTTAVVLNGLSLYHVAYSGATDNGTWERVTGFTGQLGAGKVMRVHSGSGPVSALEPGRPARCGRARVHEPRQLHLEQRPRRLLGVAEGWRDARSSTSAGTTAGRPRASSSCG